MSPDKPTITSSNLPPEGVTPKQVLDKISARLKKGAAPLLEDELSEVVAKRLGAGGGEPVFKLKNKNIYIRLINQVAGKGQRVHEFAAMGFVFATTEDVEVQPHLLVDGKIVSGDCVLMKISRKDYLGALKYNQELALKKAGRKSAMQDGMDKINRAVRETGAPEDLAKKIHTFQPDDKQTDELIGSNL